MSAASPLSARAAAFVGAATLVLNAATFLIYFGVARLTSHAGYGDILALLSRCSSATCRRSSSR